MAGIIISARKNNKKTPMQIRTVGEKEVWEGK